MGKHFSFIHCADLHLGEPFGDVRLGGSGPWNEQISKSTFKAFEKVVDAAIDNRVDAILISGDVYNSDHHSLAQCIKEKCFPMIPPDKTQIFFILTKI